MPQRLTVLDVKNSRIAPALGICSTDSRFLAWLNEAEERLLNSGLWWSTYAKFRICASNGCITLPPQMAVIEQAAICGRPIPVHDQWFEFLENGFGTRNPSVASGSSSGTGCGCGAVSGCGMSEADHRGYFPSFDDIRAGTGNNPKKLLFVCDVLADVGKKVTAYGYDSNGNWIRTQVAGVWQDGETISLAQSAGTQSATLFSSLTGIQFDGQRKGQVWLYEYDTVATTQRMIGQYQYWETRPNYARYYLPTICSSSSGGTCNTARVEIIAKLDHLPLVLDTDFLVINSLPALKWMMMAIKKEEEGQGQSDLGEAIGFETKAIAELENQLQHYTGVGTKRGLTIVGSCLGHTDPIQTLL